MMDVLIALVLLGVGYAIGRRQRQLPAALPAAEQEQRQLQEDRAAFAQLMGYSADRAYGLQDD